MSIISNWRLFGCRQQKMRVTNGTKCSAYGISQFIFFGFRILFVVSVVHVWMDRRTRTDFTQKKIPPTDAYVFFQFKKVQRERQQQRLQQNENVGKLQINRYYTNTRKIQPLEFIEVISTHILIV